MSLGKSSARSSRGGGCPGLPLRAGHAGLSHVLAQDGVQNGELLHVSAVRGQALGEAGCGLQAILLLKHRVYLTAAVPLLSAKSHLGGLPGPLGEGQATGWEQVKPGV